MVKNVYKYLVVFFIISIIILTIVIISKLGNKTNNSNNDAELKSKVSDEIDYLDFNITNIMNKLNNITVLRYKIYTQSVNTDQSGEGTSNSSESNTDKSSLKGSVSENSGNSSSQANNTNSSEKNQSTQSSSQTSNGKSSEQNSNSQASSSSSSGSLSSNASNGTSTSSQMLPNSGLIMTNNTSYIDWENISFAIENIYSTWPTINMDLQEVGISSDQINSFFTSLTGTIKSVNSKDKNSTLINLYNMYINLPKYKNIVSQDNYNLNIINTKSAILYSYVLSNTDNWEEMSNSIENAKKIFESILNSTNNSDSKKANLDKTYIIINELQNSITLNDKNIFYINYKNAIQQLETI